MSSRSIQLHLSYQTDDKALQGLLRHTHTHATPPPPHTHTYTHTAHSICCATSLKQTRWTDKQSDRMAEQGVWRTLSKMFKSNNNLHTRCVNTCISCHDIDHTKTSCWLTHLHPEPLRSSGWEQPGYIHSSAGQCDGSHDGW